MDPTHAILLHPILSIEKKCELLKISRRTYFRALKDLDFPSLNVGVLSFSKVPKIHFKKRISELPEYTQYDLKIVCLLGQRLQARINIFPTSVTQIENGLSDGSFDLAISNMCKTPDREQKFLSTYPYQFERKARGTLYLRTDSAGIRNKRIGVVSNSVHHKFLVSEKLPKTKIRCFHTDESFFKEFQKGTIEGVFTFPEIFESWAKKYRKERFWFEDATYSYDYPTCIFVSEQNKSGLTE